MKVRRNSCALSFITMLIISVLNPTFARAERNAYHVPADVVGVYSLVGRSCDGVLLKEGDPYYLPPGTTWSLGQKVSVVSIPTGNSCVWNIFENILFLKENLLSAQDGDYTCSSECELGWGVGKCTPAEGPTSKVTTYHYEKFRNGKLVLSRVKGDKKPNACAPGQIERIILKRFEK